MGGLKLIPEVLEGVLGVTDKVDAEQEAVALETFNLDAAVATDGASVVVNGSPRLDIIERELDAVASITLRSESKLVVEDKEHGGASDEFVNEV